MILKTNELPHQLAAINKLIKIKVGALYMEMGTGKTRTALGLIQPRLALNKVEHILWLCPYSVKSTIERELRKHIEGSLDYITICGIETLSSSISANVALRRLVREKKVFLVIDESNLVKNSRAKRTQNILHLAESCIYKLILNGTPISKNEADLYAQWLMLDWRILGYRSFWSFSRNHIIWSDRIRGKIEEIKNVDYLVKRIAPYSFQILKSECLDLPLKSYSTYSYDMTEEQIMHYHYVADELLLQVDEILPHTVYRLFAGLQNVIAGFKVTIGKKLSSTPLFREPTDNPRMDLLLDTIGRMSETEKVVIFAKYSQEIQDIVSVLNDHYGEGAAVPFYGQIKQKQRIANEHTFRTSARFFVANKRTAGYGLNLQFCSYAIFYSNDWDYATRNQAEDRLHRLGQLKNVHIIDFVANRSLDERIQKCLNRKESLIDAFKQMIDADQKRDQLFDWVNGKEDEYAESV